MTLEELLESAKRGIRLVEGMSDAAPTQDWQEDCLALSGLIHALIVACPQDEAEDALLKCWRAGFLDLEVSPAGVTATLRTEFAWLEATKPSRREAVIALAEELEKSATEEIPIDLD